MERVSSKEEARQAVAEARREGKVIALVPTMGALHDGHIALVRAAMKRATYVAVSIFVNPTQFAPGEDLDAYPRDLDRDIELLDAEGVDLVFTPSAQTMYPTVSEASSASGESGVTVDPGELARRWEGESRPTHFRGVATVVAKLFNIVRPRLAFFGEKDYQQLKVIERMVADLDVATVIVGHPIIREKDGLAMSSRNAYLSAEERADALGLCEALEAASQALAWGESDAGQLESVMMEELGKRPSIEVEYARVVDKETLEPISVIEAEARAIIAARVGKTRLIDNAALQAPEKD